MTKKELLEEIARNRNVRERLAYYKVALELGLITLDDIDREVYGDKTRTDGEKP